MGGKKALPRPRSWLGAGHRRGIILENRNVVCGGWPLLSVTWPFSQVSRALSSSLYEVQVVSASRYKSELHRVFFLT